MCRSGAGCAPNLTLLTNAYVERLETDPSGRTVTGVHVLRDGRQERYSADIVVVACGALSSALLLLRSASARASGWAGQRIRPGRPQLHAAQPVGADGLDAEINDTVFQKTLAVSDFYFGADDWDYPLGLIQMCASSDAEQIKGEALPSWLEWFPDMPFDEMARHSMDFWLSSEDLPRPENRIYYDGDRVVLDAEENNMEAHQRLRRKLQQYLDQAATWPVLLDRRLYLGKNIPIGGTAHQAGTCRFGADPATSVLDLDCKAHELDNLYVTDASFFPSIGAVNPTLTIIANALRVAEHLRQRLGG